MSIDELRVWGAAYGYPRMILCHRPLLQIPAGWQNWDTFLREATSFEVAVLSARIQYWEQTYRVFAARGE